MSTFEKGDRVVVTQGDFAGQRATVTDTDVVGDGITVALLDGGRQVETHEGHLEPDGAEGGVNVGKGDRVIVTEGRLKGEVGTVVDTKLLGDGIDVRLDDGRVIDTEEAHVAPCADR